MTNGLKEEVQCVFFAMIKKYVFHLSVLTPSIGYLEFGLKKIGAAKKIGSKKKTLLNGVLLLLPRPKGRGEGGTAFAAS